MPIPKIIHRISHDKCPSRAFSHYWAQWKTLHPDWKFYDWGINDYIKNHHVYNSNLIHKIKPEDIIGLIKLDILHRYGGVVIENDVQPYKNLDNMIRDKDLIYLSESENSFIASGINSISRKLNLELPKYYSQLNHTFIFNFYTEVILRDNKFKESILKLKNKKYGLPYYSYETYRGLDVFPETYFSHHWYEKNKNIGIMNHQPTSIQNDTKELYYNLMRFNEKLTLDIKKYDLSDTTFVIPFKYQNTTRLNNLLTTINFIQKYFTTNITVVESDTSSKINLDKSIEHLFAPSDFFYFTKILNMGYDKAKTPIVCSHDADAIPSINGIIDSVNSIRNKVSYFAFPHNGLSVHISDNYKNLYDGSLYGLTESIYENKKMNNEVGLSMFFNNEEFSRLGYENEEFKYWAFPDWERYERICKQGFGIYRPNEIIFHLNHEYNFNKSNNWYTDTEYNGDIYNHYSMLNPEKLHVIQETWSWYKYKNDNIDNEYVKQIIFSFYSNISKLNIEKLCLINNSMSVLEINPTNGGQSLAISKISKDYNFYYLPPDSDIDNIGIYKKIIDIYPSLKHEMNENKKAKLCTSIDNQKFDAIIINGNVDFESEIYLKEGGLIIKLDNI